MNTHPNMAGDVLQFMAAGGQLPVEMDERVPLEDFALAEELITEEVDEMRVGFDKYREYQSLENLTELVDGAIDTIYVVLWMLNKFNVPVNKCWNEVQRSNMAKLQTDGTLLKNDLGKVQKPAGWTPPDLFSILKDATDTADWKGGIRVHNNPVIVVTDEGFDKSD